jgi:hypothetical protein
MTQSLYAHMNKGNKKITISSKAIFHNEEEMKILRDEQQVKEFIPAN